MLLEHRREVFRGIQSQARGDDVQEVVCRVHMLRHRATTRLHVGNGLGHGSHVTHAAWVRSEQDQLVEHLGHLESRLMDNHHNQDVERLRDGPQGFDAQLCICGGQAGCRFIAKHHGCLCSNTSCQRHTSALAPRDAANRRSTDIGVGDACQAESREQQIDRCLTFDLGLQAMRFQGRIELDGLTDCPILGHDVLLPDIHRNARKAASIPSVTIDQHLPTVCRGLLHG
mmetsp:Transcript_175858/g.563829  ORF Transcript_175858/g.563829 Transcript_175858/m.563829 type:complete len:228 (-) Transcript_175858:284-967(-)